MKYIIRDQFDIGDDRSILLVTSDSADDFLFGDYKIISSGYDDLIVRIDGRRADANDPSGCSHLITTIEKVNLEERLSRGIKSELVLLS